MAWYYVKQDQQLGPVEESALSQLVASGEIAPETLVWKEGMSEWTPYTKVSTAPTEGATVVCSVSGKTVPKSEAIEISGKWVSRAHKEEFVQKLKEGAELPGKLIYAGFWIRCGAVFIDALILFAVNLCIKFLFLRGYDAQMQSVIHQNPTNPFANLQAILPYILISTSISIGIQLAYYVFFLGKFGATWGKQVFGLKVVRPDGQPISYARAAGRYFAYLLSSIILYIGLIIAAFDSEKRALHDRICSTRVIKSRS